MSFKWFKQFFLNIPKKIRFLLVGGWNTAFGFLLGVVLYYYLKDLTNIIIIGMISNVISITMSFTTNKLFVFMSAGNWINEYIRSYVVYGAMAFLGIFLLWFFVDICKFNIWISQTLILVISISISYLAHSRFTYKNDK